MRHEAGGVVAADAYHRASGRLAAATATYGAGFTNTLTALAEAVQAHVPLILVVGDEPTSGPRPWDVDQIALASAVGARTYTVGRADAGGHDGHRRRARADVPGADRAGDPVRRRARARPGPVPDGARARPAAARHRAAPFTARRDRGRGDRARRRRSGRSCSPAAEPGSPARARRWARSRGDRARSPAPPPSAAGVFPDARYDLGVAGGFGRRGAMELVREADVAVVFGASLNQFTMRFGELFAPGTRVIQVDVAPAATHPHVGSLHPRGCAPGGARRWWPARPRRGRAARVARVLDLAAAGASPSRAMASRADGRLDPRIGRRADRRAAARRTASSSPTAATSSAGRTCTGRSRRPTG